MKTRLFHSGKLLSCKAKASLELTKRLVFEGEIPAENFQSLQDVEANLKDAEPNAKDFENNLAREKTDTPEGRNIIRGQAILMLKRYQYEPDSKEGVDNTLGKRQQLKKLDEMIAFSRRLEVGLNVAQKPYDEESKKNAADDLKKQLDLVRGLYTDTKTGKLVPPPLKVVDIEASDTELARNQLRETAQKWLKANPETPQNKYLRDQVKNGLALSAYAETGELYNVPVSQHQSKFDGLYKGMVVADKPKETTPSDRKENKVIAAKGLKAALDAARQ